MKTITRTEMYAASSGEVFRYLDDAGVSGMHMTQSSAMMMGSRLHLQYLSEQHSGPGTKYRWTGKMMGMFMDFTVEVTRWKNGMEKTWRTIGEAKMIIYSWYEMHLLVTPAGSGSQAELSITYERPRGRFARFVSWLVADWYCNWCLRKMLKDTKKILELNYRARPARG